MITCLRWYINKDSFDKFLVVKMQAGLKILLINSSNRMIDRRELNGIRYQNKIRTNNNVITILSRTIKLERKPCYRFHLVLDNIAS